MTEIENLSYLKTLIRYKAGVPLSKIDIKSYHHIISPVMLSVEQPLFPKDILGESSTFILTVFQTPTQSEIVEGYISSILGIYEQLAELTNLDPAPEVNVLFGKLVGLCSGKLDRAIAEKILIDPRVVKITPHLRQLCSDGECRLEAHWAEKICGFDTEKDVNSALESFPYYKNYVALTRLELFSIFSATPVTPRTFAFIGSGPLPLTSLCLADLMNQITSSKIPIRIHNIDRDALAIKLSTSLCTKIGSRASSMTFQCTEAMEEQRKQDLTEFDVVFLAALVGSTKSQKTEIIEDVARRMRTGAVLVLRSAHGLRSLLYPVIDPTTDLKESILVPLTTVDPHTDIVNSVLVARVTGGQ